MKRIFPLLLMVLLLHVAVAAQSIEEIPDDVRELIQQGMEAHDEGDFDAAVRYYDQALEKLPNDFWTMSEKANTLLFAGDQEGAIELCERILELHSETQEVDNVYVTYGNALDVNGRSEDAIKAYKQGLSSYPESHMLHFNLAVTLMQNDQVDEAVRHLKNSCHLNPDHAGSQYSLGVVMAIKNERIPAIMCLVRFLVLEPTTERSARAYGIITQLVSQGVEKTGRKKVSVSLDPSFLQSKEGEPDNFATVDMILTVNTALDHDKKFKKVNPAERFAQKLENLISGMAEMPEEERGYFWDHYVPWLQSMKDHGHLKTASYIVHLSSGEDYIEKWVKGAEEEIRAFFYWYSEEAP